MSTFPAGVKRLARLLARRKQDGLIVHNVGGGMLRVSNWLEWQAELEKLNPTGKELATLDRHSIKPADHVI